MDLVLEDQLRAFQVDRGLTGLRREQAFETFATFCILGLHYEESDDIRCGDEPTVHRKKSPPCFACHTVGLSARAVVRPARKTAPRKSPPQSWSA